MGEGGGNFEIGHTVDLGLSLEASNTFLPCCSRSAAAAIMIERTTENDREIKERASVEYRWREWMNQWDKRTSQSTGPLTSRPTNDDSSSGEQ